MGGTGAAGVAALPKLRETVAKAKADPSDYLRAYATNRFHDPVRVPDEVGTGKATIVLQFPDWKEGRIEPHRFQVLVRDP